MGAVRAGAGILISSYPLNHGPGQRDPAGDNAPGMALLKQASAIAENLNSAAKTHQTAQLSGHIGSLQGNQSHLAQNIKPEAPLKAQLTSVSGMVDQARLPEAKTDAGNKHTNPGGGKLPHSADPLIAIAAKGGLTMSAGQARDDVNIKSNHAHIDWAAAKGISLATSGGANITIEGGKITVQCPGKITVFAGKKSFLGPERMKYPILTLPKGILKSLFKRPYMDTHSLQSIHSLMMSWIRLQPYIRIIFGE